MRYLTASLLGLVLIASPVAAQQTPPGSPPQQPATPDQADQSQVPGTTGVSMNTQAMHHATMRHSTAHRHRMHHSSMRHHAMRCTCPMTHVRHHHAMAHHMAKKTTTTTKS
jgi:hypothetical protein